MAGIDVSASFKQIGEIPTDYFKSGKRQMVPEVLTGVRSENLCYDLEDVFTAMQEEGDYSMLHIALRFMNNLYPADLFMFFDDLCVIERKLFNKHGLIYDCVEKSYIRYRDIIETDYIRFVVSYHREATAELFAENSDYDINQMKFLLNRSKTLLEVLPQIGTKISRNHYVDYVISDRSEFDT